MRLQKSGFDNQQKLYGSIFVLDNKAESKTIIPSKLTINRGSNYLIAEYTNLYWNHRI